MIVTAQPLNTSEASSIDKKRTIIEPLVGGRGDGKLIITYWIIIFYIAKFN